MSTTSSSSGRSIADAGSIPVRSSLRRRWGIWASVALNVFLLAVIGAHFGARWMHTPPRPGLDGFTERLAHDLPAPDADRFRAAMEHERPLLRAAQERLEEARAALSRAIARTPYDEALMRQRLSELQQRWQEMSERFAGALAPTVGNLSEEGRTRLADALARPRPPPRPGAPDARR